MQKVISVSGTVEQGFLWFSLPISENQVLIVEMSGIQTDKCLTDFI
jgi:hypothetical protein